MEVIAALFAHVLIQQLSPWAVRGTEPIGRAVVVGIDARASFVGHCLGIGHRAALGADTFRPILAGELLGREEFARYAIEHVIEGIATVKHIDTSVSLDCQLFPRANKAGTRYRQSESQSVDELNRLKAGSEKAGIVLEAIPVSNSSETQLITQSILAKDIDVFFALPDNVIFSSFETIVKACNDKNIPVMTIEAGPVSRGALASFGADMYQWGYQAEIQAVKLLKSGSTEGIQPEMVRVRKKVMSKSVAEKFMITPDSSYTLVP